MKRHLRRAAHVLAAATLLGACLVGWSIPDTARPAHVRPQLPPASTWTARVPFPVVLP